jgi:putative oxidoreductase
MIFDRLRRWYVQYVHWVSLLQHPLLLACRIYWGATFVQAGFGKLTHLSLYAERFANWHIPAPQFNAVMAGITECVCGSLLIVGAGSRIITVPLIVTMIVAYRTAHVDEVTSVYSFVTAPPFLNLLTCVLVLLFGPGALSVDYLLGRFLPGANSEPTTKIPQRWNKPTTSV